MGLFGAEVVLLLLLTNTVPPSPASVPKLCKLRTHFSFQAYYTQLFRSLLWCKREFDSTVHFVNIARCQHGTTQR